MRKGIMIGGMVLGLLMLCNNGVAELEKNNKFLSSLANLGNEFLNVFTSFGDTFGEMFSETLGFKAASSKKEDVGKYFKKIHEKVEGTKTALKKIVSDMKSENNPNATSVEGAVNKLVSEKLDKIIEGANKVSEAIGEASEPIGNVEGSAAGGAVGTGIEKLVNGIKDIVDIVLKNEGQHDAGDDKKASDLSQSRTASNANDAGKLFGNATAGSDDKNAAIDAAKAVGAVTGADILQAMAKNGDSAKLASENAAAGAAGATSIKDATIAGGIALRAIAKGGKFANGSNNTHTKKIVEGVAVGAVTKALDTLTIAIRKTIDEELKKVKEAMNINANDSAVTSATGAAK